MFYDQKYQDKCVTALVLLTYAVRFVIGKFLIFVKKHLKRKLFCQKHLEFRTKQTRKRLLFQFRGKREL